MTLAMLLTSALIVFLVFVAPIWVVAHYLTRWRSVKALSAEDERLLAALWRDAEKIDERLRSLERILDAETPEWRRER